MSNTSEEERWPFVRAGGNQVPTRILAILGLNEMKMFGPGVSLAPYASQPGGLRWRDAR